MSSKTAPVAAFSIAFTALMVALHLPYLKLPFFWDELGQFVPAALDILQRGAWIPQTALPNVHPPGVMAYLALVWKVFGFSILATRLAMLVVASAGVLLSFLLAIRLSRGTVGAPAFAAVLFLIFSPLFYTQAMTAQLDMPAMTLTVGGLLLFLDRRYLASAAACTALVLVKETGLSAPLVFAAWLWFRERKRRESLYFAAPVLALTAWLVALHHATGYWLGNPGFAQYNVSDSLQPAHILATLLSHAYFLFIANGAWIGAIALFVGARVLRNPDWTLAFLVAGAQVLLVTVFGGAALDRYLLPAIPIVFAAMSAAATAYPSSWRWTTQVVMIGAFVIGMHWNPPYPFPLEDNLAMTDFVGLQQVAAEYLEEHAPHSRIASAWPFTDAVKRPEFGYVSHPLKVDLAQGFQLDRLADLDIHNIDILVIFSQTWGADRGIMANATVQGFLTRYFGYRPQATPDQIRAGLGFLPVMRWTRGGQWIEIYLPER